MSFGNNRRALASTGCVQIETTSGRNYRSEIRRIDLVAEQVEVTSLRRFTPGVWTHRLAFDEITAVWPIEDRP